jgi:hypothetical protein
VSNDARLAKGGRTSHKSPRFWLLESLFIPCIGGPCLSRLEVCPPRLEVEELGGTYVLVDGGQRQEWRYQFVPHQP